LLKIWRIAELKARHSLTGLGIIRLWALCRAALGSLKGIVSQHENPSGTNIPDARWINRHIDVREVAKLLGIRCNGTHFHCWNPDNHRNCDRCLENELPDYATVRATCRHCGHEVEFPTKKGKRAAGLNKWGKQVRPPTYEPIQHGPGPGDDDSPPW